MHKIDLLILEALQIPDPGESVCDLKRSGQWPAVRDAYLESHPDCEACGSRKDLNVHHVIPFHIDPDRELDPENLITLCRLHHFDLGHLGAWAAWFPLVREIAALHRFAYRMRQVLMREIRKDSA